MNENQELVEQILADYLEDRRYLVNVYTHGSNAIREGILFKAMTDAMTESFEDSDDPELREAARRQRVADWHSDN